MFDLLWERNKIPQMHSDDDNEELTLSIEKENNELSRRIKHERIIALKESIKNKIKQIMGADLENIKGNRN